MISKSNSGLQTGDWIERSLLLKERRGVRNGYFFADSKGRKMSSRNLEPRILERIIEVQRLCPELVRSEVDVYESYGIPRSFRRGSNSEAQNRGVSDSDIDKNNQWRKVGGSIWFKEGETCNERSLHRCDGSIEKFLEVLTSFVRV